MNKQRVLILSGKKQAGKNTLANFVRGLTLLQKKFIKEFEVSEKTEGKLYVRQPDIGYCKFNFQPFEKFQNDRPETNFSKHVHVYAYADELKRIMIDLFGLRPEQVDGDDEEKNSLTKYRWENLPAYAGPKTGFLTARELIQYMGTEIFRKIYPDIHILATLEKIKRDRPDLAVIEGCRFPNEVLVPRAQADFDVKIVRLTRTVCPEDTHSSETSLDRKVFDWKNFDYVIENDNMTVEQGCCELLKYLKKIGWVK